VSFGRRWPVAQYGADDRLIGLPLQKLCRDRDARARLKRFDLRSPVVTSIDRRSDGQAEFSGTRSWPAARSAHDQTERTVSDHANHLTARKPSLPPGAVDAYGIEPMSDLPTAIEAAEIDGVLERAELSSGLQRAILVRRVAGPRLAADARSCRTRSSRTRWPLTLALGGGSRYREQVGGWRGWLACGGGGVNLLRMSGAAADEDSGGSYVYAQCNAPESLPTRLHPATVPIWPRTPVRESAEAPSLPSGLECQMGLFGPGLGLRYAVFVCHDRLEWTGFDC
jgi:hypothetical protein